MVDVREATGDDVPKVAETLASAFEHDPVLAWMTPEQRRRERLRRFFTRSLEVGSDRATVVTAGGYEGAAVWLPPGRWRVPPAELLRAAPTMVRAFGARLPRVLGGLSVIEKNHPTDEHWYLEFLGTRGDLQRKGVGTAVIGLMLDRCDDEGIPAYLEATSPENVPFYRRHGFEVRQQLEMKGGPPLWGMWRDPR